MIFESRLNLKLYIVSVLLLIFVIFGWYGTYFLNANEILMEDNTPMTDSTKIIFTVLLCIILLSGSISLLTLIKQIIMGYGFKIDQNGIHNTATAFMVFSLIFVIPVKNIPFSAIRKISTEDDVLTLYIDKSKIDVLPFLRLFVSKKYRLFSGFIKEKPDEIKDTLRRFIKQDI